jgi:outer membrane protein assembly factor BamB
MQLTRLFFLTLLAQNLLCLAPIQAQDGTKSVGDWAFEWAWAKKEVASAGNAFWPQYRGPKGDGHADVSAKPPVQWAEDKNIAWKHSLDGKAWSSPVVWGNRVWITNATKDGLSMSVHCLERSTGKVLWERVVFTNAVTQKDYHEFNSYASPTPLLDDKHLFVTFGAYGTACLNRDTGATLWERRDLECNHYRGAGSSPIFFRNTLIFHMDGFDQQYLIALDRATGKTVWKSNRNIDYGTDNGDYKKGYGTPHVIQVETGTGPELQLISPAAKAVIAYNPETGLELWKVRYEEHSASLRPLFDGKTVFTSTGFSKGKLLAIRPEGRGDITESNRKWEASKSIGAKPSPLLVADNVYTLEDKGVLSAINKTNGELVWQKRLGGDFSSSPIFANGNLYCLDEKGKSHVVSPSGDVLAVNSLSAGCLASPAAVEGDLIIRTRDALYCIRE